MSRKKFVTVVNCIDGRTQLCVSEWLRRRFAADYVDSITEPGPDGILAAGQDEVTIAAIRRRVEISVNAHGSQLVAIVGHHDCAGNPVDKTTHLYQLQQAYDAIQTWGFPVEVICLWVDENWQVQLFEE